MLKQSTARNVAILMTDSSDHVTGKTGLTLTLTASKDGGAFASITPTVTELSNGWYSLALTTTHTNTLGDLLIHATATGADPGDLREQVFAKLPGEDVTVTGDFSATMKTSIGTAVAASAVASVTGNVGGNVVGSVGSVTARVTANTDQLAGQTVTAGAGVTFPASVASPTNITAASGVALTSAYDAAKTASQAGDAMTLTSGERTSVAAAIWNALTSGLTTVGSIGKLLVDNINATIASRLASASYTAPPTAADNASAVWDEALAGHATAGSAGAVLSAAGTAGDPWATALPGAYGAGSAGNIVGNNLDAAVSTRSTYAGADTSGTTTLLSRLTGTRAGLLDNLDAAVSSRSSHSAADVWAVTTRTLSSFGALAADTASAVWSAVTRTLTAGTNIVLAKGTGITGLNDLDAAGIRSALGLALANLDDQIAALSTYDGSDTAGTTTLLARLTAIRAALLDNLDAAISSRLAAVDYVAPDNSDVLAVLGVPVVDVSADLASAKAVADAIKAKTDGITFTKSGEIDANVQSVNDVTVNGTGAVGNEWGP